MRRYKIGFVLLQIFFLVACSHSPESQFYVLNPLPPEKMHSNSYSHLRIGITQINSPSYTMKPEFMVHQSVNRIKLEEFHRWAESLDKNIQRVLEANLMSLLPGAAIINAPWDMKFVPNYQLRIDISQLEVNTNGHSTLRADYIIYSEAGVIKKGTLYYHQKVPHVTVETLVGSMNANLTHLSRDIARVFASLD